jgi:hypothetical protein
MRRLIGVLTLSLATVAVVGCGGPTDAGPTTGTGADARAPEQKQSDDMMRQALEKARANRR